MTKGEIIMDYFGKGNEELVITRSRCHGYKTLKISDKVSMASHVKFETENEDVLAVNVTEEESETKKITFLCDEFGLYGYKDKGGMYAKVSIIFCDNGKMLVTLHEGTLILNYEGDLVQPILGVDNCSKVTSPNNIYWVNADTILSNKCYFGNEIQQVHTQDFEYFFTLSGGKINDCASLKIKVHKDEFVDLSLGHVAVMEEELLRKEEAKRAKKIVGLSVSAPSQTGAIDIDDYGDDEEEEDTFYEYED